MQYALPGNDHGLAHDPFKAIVAPRPIGWISSLSPAGVANLAPYSFFNAVSSSPHIVMFSSNGWKDSVANIAQTGEFVANYVDEPLAEAMNATSVPAPGAVSEFDYAGLRAAPSRWVAPPRVARARAALECRLSEIIQPKTADGGDSGHWLVLGEVVGVYIEDEAIVDGRFQVELTRPVARLGYLDFAGIGGTFELRRPDWTP